MQKKHRTHKSIWINESSVNPKSTSNKSSKPCTVLQYPSKKKNRTYRDMHTYVYMYIYMCVCLYVCVRMCTYWFIHISMYSYIYVYLLIYLWRCASLKIHICGKTQRRQGPCHTSSTSTRLNLTSSFVTEIILDSHTHHTTNPYVWHDPSIRLIRPIHTCGTDHSYVWHDPRALVMWLILTRTFQPIVVRGFSK